MLVSLTQFILNLYDARKDCTARPWVLIVVKHVRLPHTRRWRRLSNNHLPWASDHRTTIAGRVVFKCSSCLGKIRCTANTGHRHCLLLITGVMFELHHKCVERRMTVSLDVCEKRERERWKNSITSSDECRVRYMCIVYSKNWLTLALRTCRNTTVDLAPGCCFWFIQDEPMRIRSVTCRHRRQYFSDTELEEDAYERVH